MRHSQYQLIAEHPLRTVLRNMVTHRATDMPGKAALREMIDEALPGVDAKVRDAVYAKAVELGRAALERPDEHFDLRGAADRMVLKVVEGLEAADRLFPDNEEHATDDEVDAAADEADYGTYIGGKAGYEGMREISDKTPESSRDWD